MEEKVQVLQTLGTARARLNQGRVRGRQEGETRLKRRVVGVTMLIDEYQVKDFGLRSGTPVDTREQKRS